MRMPRSTPSPSVIRRTPANCDSAPQCAATARRLMRRPKRSTIRKTLSAVMPQAYTERSIQSIDISVQQAAPREIAHQRADAADPGGRFGAGPHAVHHRAGPRCGDTHEVADRVGEGTTRPLEIMRRSTLTAEDTDGTGGHTNR